jgi:hypothetical protein
MKMATFRNMCPHLFQILDTLAHNNGIKEFPEVWFSVETQIKFPPIALEKLASQLTATEKGILADGEQSEILKLIKDHKIQKLQDFVAFCFENN